MSSKDVIESALEHLRIGASVKAVYGEPVVIDGKTIIPVARVAYGFGGGTGAKGDAAKEAAAQPGQEIAKEAPGAAPGASAARPSGEGAGGVIANPVGVVEISGQETKFVAFGQAKKLATAAVIGSGLGLALGLLLGARRRN